MKAEVRWMLRLTARFENVLSLNRRPRIWRRIRWTLERFAHLPTRVIRKDCLNRPCFFLAEVTQPENLPP